MNQTPETVPQALVTPLPDRSQVILALSQEARWKMLKELCAGEPRSVGELAEAGGCAYANAINHLRVLRESGLVVQGRGRLYQLVRAYLPQPGVAVVDLGHCLLRLDAAPPATA